MHYIIYGHLESKEIDNIIFDIDANKLTLTVHNKAFPLYSLNDFNDYFILRYGKYGQNIVNLNRDKLSKENIEELLLGLVK